MYYNIDRVNLFSTEINDLTPHTKRFFSKNLVTIFAYSNDTILGINDIKMNRRFAGTNSSEYEIAVLLRNLVSGHSDAGRLKLLQVALSEEARKFDSRIPSFAVQFNQVLFCDIMCDLFNDQRRKFHQIDPKPIEGALYTFFLYLNFLWFIRHQEFNSTFHELKANNHYEKIIDDIIVLRDDGEEIISTSLFRELGSTFNTIYYEMCKMRENLPSTSPDPNVVNEVLLDLRYNKIHKFTF